MMSDVIGDLYKMQLDMGEDKNEKTTRLNLLSRLEVTSAAQS